MGATSTETKREIERLRAELTEIIDELEQRGSRALNVRSQIADHPTTSGALAVGLSMALGALGYTLVHREQERREREKRLDRRARRLVGSIFDPLEDRVGRLKLVRENRNGRESIRVKREPSMVKRILWMGMSAALVALGTLLARKLSQTVWEKAMHERPPTVGA